MIEDDDWQKFLESGDINRNDINENNYQEPPKPSLLYISTKTKIVYLNRNIDLDKLFWKIKIIPYAAGVCFDKKDKHKRLGIKKK